MKLLFFRDSRLPISRSFHVHVKAIFNLNVTRERRVELDVIGESYLVRGLIINCFSVLVYKCTALWLGFEQMKLCKLPRCDMQHSNQIFAVLRLPSAKV